MKIRMRGSKLIQPSSSVMLQQMIVMIVLRMNYMSNYRLSWKTHQDMT